MRKNNYIYSYLSIYIIVVFIYCLFSACSGNESGNERITSGTGFDYEVTGFNMFANLKTGNDSLVVLELDYSDSFLNGFTIPGNDKYLHFSFSINNKTEKATRFYYKIYYQNESYKFDEVDKSGNYNPLSGENFYGSWENASETFRVTKDCFAGSVMNVSDSVRIIGNPRQELRYYSDSVNNRWKRNPRVGLYSFLLVVFSADKYEKDIVPEYISNISGTSNGDFINPFFYFKFSKDKDLGNPVVVASSKQLKVYARPPVSEGIYIPPGNFKNDNNSDHFNSYCNQDSKVYYSAAFEQFINNQDPSMRFYNIPVVRDIMADDYTLTDYNWDLAFYSKDETISTMPEVSRYPCEDVYIDTSTGGITMINPGCVEGKWRKQSVGIRTRHGFTYGKYTIKCKLTELLNSNNIWNGLTNAIWLLNQQQGGTWNNRRDCTNEGYLSSYWGGANDSRVSAVDYSEIDFEILKTPPYCPSGEFPPVITVPNPDRSKRSSWDIPWPEDLEGTEPMITVACTNWDMACPQPVNFNSGCNDILFDNQAFSSHRWTRDYRAITQKKYAPDDELFAGDYYYFQIDWKPKEIIWRIGPTPENLKVVGYMNDSITMIPNNQMTLIITQEYHNTKWWPGSPFVQENIPFPLKDLVGKIYEITIE